MQVSHRVVLHFPAEASEQPVVYRLSRDYDLVFNILRASIGSGDQGLMVLELSGEEENYARAAGYLKEQGITLQPLVQDIGKSDEKCIDCGACVGVCPAEALTLERPSMEVKFDPDQCVACGECVATCLVGAMEMRF